MTELLLSKITNKESRNFLKRPSHALLIVGLDASGRTALAKKIIAELLGVSNFEASSRYTAVEPDKNSNITIDQIRQLKQSTKLKTDSSRVILISDADKMQSGAQNSLLKLLEEPPGHTFIILTALPGSLKPTIVSRAQRINIKPVTLAEAQRYFKASPAVVELAYQISGGRLGVVKQLLNSDDHPLKSATLSAKQILKGDYYERLCQVDVLAKNKESALETLSALTQMASSTLSSVSANDSDDITLARWHRVLAASYRAETALNGPANTKLVITNLMLAV